MSENPGHLVDPDFRQLVDSSSVAILIKDDDGFYTHANSAAEALLGFGPGELIGLQMADVCPADPELIRVQFERLKREQNWSGRFFLRSRAGQLLEVGVHACARLEVDGTASYLDFVHPLAQGTAESAARQERALASINLCFLQLRIDGFTDHQAAVLLGLGREGLRLRQAAVREALEVASVTEACIVAIKRHLIF